MGLAACKCIELSAQHESTDYLPGYEAFECHDQAGGRRKADRLRYSKEYEIENNADTTALGTRGYAAPEQFGDSKGRGIYNTDARTDIYNLGATLYHIVTGKNPCEPPYEIKPIREWNPMLSSGLEKIILKCTQADPNDRYQNCTELMYALEHYDELDDSYRKKNKKKLGLLQQPWHWQLYPVSQPESDIPVCSGSS